MRQPNATRIGTGFPGAPRCKWCEDRGCVVCGQSRSDIEREQAMLREALEWMRSQQISPPASLNELLSVVAQAIEHGREQIRGRHRPEPVATDGDRWSRLEVDDFGARDGT